MIAVVPYKDRSSTSITAVPPQYNRRAIANKYTGATTAIPWRFYCDYGGATTVLPPHWPRGAAANIAVMPPMIAVAPPSNRSQWGRHVRSDTAVVPSHGEEKHMSDG